MADMVPATFYTRLLKPLLDFVSAFLLLIICSPVLILVCMVLKVVGQGVFFAQRRPGYLGRSFVMYKLKSMRDDRQPWPLGDLLRKTSLDELPQLWNILKGEMSFIGPRPLFESYMDQYTEAQRHRHDVKPGITGWAQVNGRNALSLEDKVALDLEYVAQVSFRMDLLILIKTLLQLFKWKEADYHKIDHQHGG